MRVKKTDKSIPLPSYYSGVVYLEPKQTREVDVLSEFTYQGFQLQP